MSKKWLSGICQGQQVLLSSIGPDTQNADIVTGEDLPVINCIRASTEIGKLNVVHDFVVVKSLVASVLYGIDFLHANALALHFATIPFSTCHVQSQ